MRRIREVMFQSRHWQSVKHAPADSWWTRPECQQSRAAFAAIVAERDAERQRDRRIAAGDPRGRQAS